MQEYSQIASTNKMYNNKKITTMETRQPNYEMDSNGNRFMGVKNTLKSNYSIFNKLSDEGCEGFYSYIAQQGVCSEEDVIVLSSVHYYFYSEEEFRDGKNVVNLKQLNHEKELDSFLDSIAKVLPSRSCMFGCFVNNDKYKVGSMVKTKHSLGKDEVYEDGIKSRNRIIDKLIDIIDARTNRYLTPAMVTSLLEHNGFSVVDMTEVNGVTYFCSRKVKTAAA